MPLFDEDSDSSIEIIEVRRPPRAQGSVGDLIFGPSASTDDDDDDDDAIQVDEEDPVNEESAMVETIQVDSSDECEEDEDDSIADDEEQQDNVDTGEINNSLAHLDEIDLPDYCANELPDSFSMEVGGIDRDLTTATQAVLNPDGQSSSEEDSGEEEVDDQHEEETGGLSSDEASRFAKALNRQLQKDRRELTNARMDRLVALLDKAPTPSRSPGVLVKLPCTYDSNVRSKLKGRTFCAFTSDMKQGWGVSHPFVRLDSTPVSVMEDQMPKNVARVLLDSPFANLKHLESEEGNLEFVSSRFDQEGKTEEELAEFRSLFNIKPREIEIARGPWHKREEADELVNRLLVFWNMSSFRRASLEQLTEILLELFPPPKYYEPDLRLKVQKYYTNRSSEAVFAAPKPDTTCDPVVETTHPGLAGDDPDYLKAIDTYRNLFCVRCKMFLCNLHLEYEPGSLQIQYEAAIAEEHARGRRRVLHDLPSPKYRDKWIPTRRVLNSFDKAICRRLFLIYEGDMEKVAQFLNVSEDAVISFCRGFKLPSSPKFLRPLTAPKNLQQWYSTKCYPVKLYNANSRTANHERNAFFPCFHDGPCENPKSECTCVHNRHFCTICCARGRYSRNYFRGCSCKGPCTTMCTCYLARRECDPLLCSCTRCNDPAGKPRATQRCQNDNITMRRRQLTYVGISEIPGSGFGLFTRYFVPKDSYIDEYIGEIISHDEGQRRGIIYDAECNTSLFHVNLDLWIDASDFCGHMRFINFSSTPNIRTRIVSVRGESRIGFFAMKDIPAQTEMTLNYDFQDGKNVADGVPGFLPQATKKKDSGTGKKSRRKGNPKKRKML